MAIEARLVAKYEANKEKYIQELREYYKNGQDYLNRPPKFPRKRGSGKRWKVKKRRTIRRQPEAGSAENQAENQAENRVGMDGEGVPSED